MKRGRDPRERAREGMFEFTLPPLVVLSSFPPPLGGSDETTGKPDAGPCAHILLHLAWPRLSLALPADGLDSTALDGGKM